MVEINQAIERIAKLKESEIGPTEENVKQKVIVPLLESLGHERQDLEFEYRTRSGGKLDIFIKNVPSDCKVIIDTKNYNENLNDYVEQIRDYTFDESSLLTIIANGTEIRIYSPLRGVAFERSMLYSIKRQDLNRSLTWNTLSSLLQNESLRNRSVLRAIEEREKEIKAAMSEEERVKEECKSRIEGIEIDIEAKEEEIEQLKNERDIRAKEAESKIREVWKKLDLPLEVLRSSSPPLSRRAMGNTIHESVGKARKVRLQELLDAGLIKNGQTVCFFHGRVYKEERAEIVASQNKLKYKGDGKLYSISEIAKIVDIKLGLKHDDHGVAGPRYWQTEDGRLLDDLNDVVRGREK